MWIHLWRRQSKVLNSWGKLNFLALNPKHTGLFANLIIPGGGQICPTTVSGQWVPWQKKCKANIPSTSKLEHILFLHSPWKNFLSTLKVPLNFSNFHYRHIMRELAFLRFLSFLAPKMLKSKNKGDLPFVFFNFKQLLFYEKSL